MPTIDLTSVAANRPSAANPPMAQPESDHPIDAAPRRIGLTLTELQHAAGLVGDAPLPFDVAPAAQTDGMQNRLGRSPLTTDDQAFRTSVGAQHDPAESLTRRGLADNGVLDSGLAGAIGLLAAPRIALDVDLRMAGVQTKVWHRQSGRAVATLATVDGIVFEVGWFSIDAWPTELARVGALSEEVDLGDSVVPSYVDLPYELVDAAAEAGRMGRGDLLPVLAARHSGAVTGPDGVLPDDAVTRLLNALTAETQGRLRALVADVSGADVHTAGVVSWALLADGWRALRPHNDGDERRLELSSVDASELAAQVAPVLAPLVAGGTAHGGER